MRTLEEKATPQSASLTLIVDKPLVCQRICPTACLRTALALRRRGVPWLCTALRSVCSPLQPFGPPTASGRGGNAFFPQTQAFALQKMPEMTYTPSFLIRASFFRYFVNTLSQASLTAFLNSQWSLRCAHKFACGSPLLIGLKGSLLDSATTAGSCPAKSLLFPEGKRGARRPPPVAETGRSRRSPEGVEGRGQREALRSPGIPGQRSAGRYEDPSETGNIASALCARSEATMLNCGTVARRKPRRRDRQIQSLIYFRAKVRQFPLAFPQKIW